MGKKFKIPKNLDIEEIVERDERTRNRTSIENRRQQFVRAISVSTQRDKEIEQEIAKKIENYNKRRDAEDAEQKRKEIYLKAIEKVQNSEER